MARDTFFTDARLPFVEGRCSGKNQRNFKAHMHKGFSIGGITCGQALFEVNNRSIILVPGSLALINPQTLHSCNATGSEGRSYFMLHLDIAWCLQLQQSLFAVDTFLPATTTLLQEPVLFAEYKMVMEKLLDCRADLLEKEQMLFRLLAAVFKKSVQHAESSPDDGPHRAMVDHLKELLAADLQEELILADLARLIGANPYTLLRRFKHHTGITPHAFRTNCRIEEARKLLQQGMEIADVALQCGFFDQSHLHRHFKAMTTLTPKEYQVNFIQ
jgi:AraC-like DNA-binding protein